MDSRWIVAIAFAALVVPRIWGQSVCEHLESQQQLVSQRLKATKTCTESTVVNGWTDCIFRAGKTEVRIVGAIGATKEQRQSGYLGSGFWVLSVDDGMSVRSMND